MPTVVDRKRNRAVKVDIFTGILPYGRKLLELQNRGISLLLKGLKDALFELGNCRQDSRLWIIEQ